MLFMFAIGLVALGLLLFVSALRPTRSALSLYELRRRQAAGDRAAAAALRREALLTQGEALKQPASALLLVILALAFVVAFGWQWGTVVAAVTALLYSRASGISWLRHLARRLYQSREEAALSFMTRHKKKLSLLTGKVPAESRAMTFGSREELLHLITESEAILSPDDKKLLTHALSFAQRRVADVMTERERIVAVDHKELLGPLVLSDLHKTEHSCFPVIVGDLNHIVGMLDVRSLLTLETKRSVTAAKAMTPRVFYIRGDQTLDHALAAFVRTRYHLLVVINEEGVTLGLVSLRDVLEALFGRPMADEFASDSDLHLVAKR